MFASIQEGSIPTVRPHPWRKWQKHLKNWKKFLLPLRKSRTGAVKMIYMFHWYEIGRTYEMVRRSVMHGGRRWRQIFGTKLTPVLSLWTIIYKYCGNKTSVVQSRCKMYLLRRRKQQCLCRLRWQFSGRGCLGELEMGSSKNLGWLTNAELGTKYCGLCQCPIVYRTGPGISDYGPTSPYGCWSWNNESQRCINPVPQGVVIGFSYSFVYEAYVYCKL